MCMCIKRTTLMSVYSYIYFTNSKCPGQNLLIPLDLVCFVIRQKVDPEMDLFQNMVVLEGKREVQPGVQLHLLRRSHRRNLY